jgi:hypothetical protein
MKHTRKATECNTYSALVSSCGTNLSQVVTGLPVDGRAVYVRLRAKIGDGYVVYDYTYTAHTQ